LGSGFVTFGKAQSKFDCGSRDVVVLVLMVELRLLMSKLAMPDWI